VTSPGLLITQIANGLSTTTELIQNLSTELKDNTIELATIKADLTNVTEDVKSLSRILKEGNGTAPVLSRIAILETKAQKIEELNFSISELKNSTTLLTQAINEIKNNSQLQAEDKKSRRQALVAIITSFVALISAILVALLG
jgi:methyl-accepting chemotaxis protein